MLYLLAFLLVLEIGAQTCPNRCSGHGTCVGGKRLLCDCSDGWEGPDCSIKACPFAPAWAAHARSTDDVHNQSVECSGVGICDRSKGECVCSGGFEGAACEKMKCGGSSTAICGKAGRCISLRQAALGYDGFRLVHPSSHYDEWDADRIQGCLCDEGFSGVSCGKRLCPRGDDPSTPGVAEVQEITCECSSVNKEGKGDCAPGGSWTVSFAGRTARIRANAVSSKAFESYDMPRGSGAAIGESLQSVLESLRPAVPTFSSVTYSAADASGSLTVGACTSATTDKNVIRVSFLKSVGDAPEIQAGSGNLVDAAGFPAVVSVITLQRGTTESLPCSNQGSCNTGDGQCTCYPGRYASDGNGNSGNINDCGTFSPPPNYIAPTPTPSEQTGEGDTILSNSTDAVAETIVKCPSPTCNQRGECVISASSSETFAYVADSANNLMRKIDRLGAVTVLAGSMFGVPGAVDGVSTSASFTEPTAIAVNSLTNDVFVVEREGRRIRKINIEGVVTTFAGSGIPRGQDGVGIDASFRLPQGIAMDQSESRGQPIYISDRGMHSIRRIDSVTGAVTTIAGGIIKNASYEAWNAGDEDGVGTRAAFFNPWGVAIDQTTGLIYVSDYGNHLIRIINPLTRNVTTLAGSREIANRGQPGSDGTGTSASFLFPTGIAVANDFTRGLGTPSSSSLKFVFVLDAGGTLRRISLSTRVVTTIAGTVGWRFGLVEITGSLGMSTWSERLPSFSDDLGSLTIVDAADGVEGYALVADIGNNAIKKVFANGRVSTLAGGISDSALASAIEASKSLEQSLSPLQLAAISKGRADGVGTSARFSSPMGVTHAIISGPKVARCACFDGFMGPTCLERRCPTGRAWFDEPRSAKEAHAEVECSGRGDCVTGTGVCECLDGFTGAACERILCPTSVNRVPCSGHGKCLTLRELAYVGSFDGKPLGVEEVQEVQCMISGGLFYVRAQNSRTPLLPWDISLERLEEAIEDLPSVGFVTIRPNPPSLKQACADREGNRFQVTFTTVLGDVKPLEFVVVEGGVGKALVKEVLKGNKTTYGKDLLSPVTWDADQMYGCHCDGLDEMNHTNFLKGDRGRWFGPGCSLRTCPVGSDLLASLPNSAESPTPEVQQIQCTALLGSFSLVFRGRKTTQIQFSDTAKDLKRKLEELESIGLVNVQVLNSVTLEIEPNGALCSSFAPITRITFVTELGDLPPFEVDPYYLSTYEPFTGVYTDPGADLITISEAVKGVSAISECAGRGLCNRNTGTCSCFPAWFSSDGRGKMGRRGDCGIYSIQEYDSINR